MTLIINYIYKFALSTFFIIISIGLYIYVISELNNKEEELSTSNSLIYDINQKESNNSTALDSIINFDKEIEVLSSVKDINLSNQIDSIEDTSKDMMESAKETIMGSGFFFGK